MTRQVNLEFTDTAEGRCCPINYGRFRSCFSLVHADIVSGKMEVIALIGEGEIAAIEKVWVDNEEVYPTTPAWATCQVRTGSLTQTAVTNISNATIVNWTHPGYAYVAIQLTLATADIRGGIPRVEVQGRGMLCPDPSTPGNKLYSSYPTDHLLDALMSADYGCGVLEASIAYASGTGSFNAASAACSSLIDYTSVQAEQQTSSNTSVGLGDYDRLQSFVMPAHDVIVHCKVNIPVGGDLSPVFYIRATPDGANVGGFMPIYGTVVAGDYIVETQFLGNYFTAGATYYLVFPAASNTTYKWHLNSLTNLYANGKAQAKITGVWTDVNYDHYFQVARFERTYEAMLTVLDRQLLESIAATLLRTCHGRFVWYDGKYRVSLDGSAANAGTASDDPADSPSVPILEGSLVCSHDDSEIPNVAVGTYYDVDDWTRKEVKYQHSTILNGSEQPKELRVSIATPAGGQLYRLLVTWLKRARRTWRASCRVAQHGLVIAAGDYLILLSRLFTGTKTVLVNAIEDNADGTFTLSLVEYDSTDFVLTPYVPQAIIATTTAS